MAVTYGFFNSVNGDRKYNAEQMSEYFRGIINEGVYQHLDGGLAVTAGTGLAVNVAAGRAIIQNRWIQNSAAMSLTIAAASETYARKDAVVIRLNWSSRAISIAVKTGTPAASPVAPSMTRNATTYEIALAYVNVAANATSVTVTDKRSDSTVCGWVTVAQSTSGEVDAMLNAMKTGFDGVTYSSPVEMVQTCDTKLQSEMRAYSEKSGYYTTSGTFDAQPPSNQWHSIVDFIPVTDVSAISMTLYKNCGGVCYYNNKFEFISCETTSSTSGEEISSLTVPENAVYVRFSWYRSNFSLTLSNGNMMVNTKDVLEKAVKTISDLDISMLHTNGNLYTCSLITWEKGKFINGDTISNQNLLKLSDYIPIFSYTKLHIKFTNNGSDQSIKGSFFDVDHNYISKIGGGTLFDIPSNAYYVRLNGLSDDNKMISERNTAYCTSKFIASGSSYISKWTGHTINALGDSITYGHGLPDREAQRWTTLLATKTGATVNNYGVSSSKISDISGDSTPSFVDRVSTLPTADLNIIFGGTNDYWHAATEIGNVDSSDVSTFCGGLNYVLNYLQTNNPTGRLLFVFPMHQKYGGNTDAHDFGYGTFDDFREAAKQVCIRNGVPMLDLYSDSGISSMVTAQMSAYTSDGIHLNPAGQQLACDLIYQMIEFGIV